jgi:peptide chain release factor 2
LETVFDLAGKQRSILGVEAEMSNPGFWERSEYAQKTVQKLKNLKGLVTPLVKANRESDDLHALMEMAEDDPVAVREVRGEIERLENELDALELKALMTGANDDAGAIMTINSRDGGTDAADWAEMLLRMYLQWAQKNGFSTEILDRHDGEVAGINSASIVVRGPMAYGYLKGEEGVHRLVRISPFNAEGKRQTSFAAIDVSPEIDDSVEIDIQDKDVREDVYRASGAGGQHVNKTSSAVRLTHIPTGSVVACQGERSQHQNRAMAWKMLRAKLARLEEESREAQQQAKYSQKARTGFGSQIRNYFLHPDQRIKDSRTGFAVNNFHAMLDGNAVQGFLDAYLRWHARGASVEGGEDEDA